MKHLHLPVSHEDVVKNSQINCLHLSVELRWVSKLQMFSSGCRLYASKYLKLLNVCDDCVFCGIRRKKRLPWNKFAFWHTIMVSVASFKSQVPIHIQSVIRSVSSLCVNESKLQLSVKLVSYFHFKLTINLTILWLRIVFIGIQWNWGTQLLSE